MASDGSTRNLSQEQLIRISNYVVSINSKNDRVTSRRIQALNAKLDLSVGEKNLLSRLLSAYNKAELTIIDVLESLITVLENISFLLKYLKDSPRLNDYLNMLILKVSKIWMVLTMKSSIWRYWKLTKLEKALVITKSDAKLIAKAKSYTLINLGLCIVELIELLEVKYFSWLISIYNVYRMVGNGTLCLEDNEEKIVQALFEEYGI